MVTLVSGWLEAAARVGDSHGGGELRGVAREPHGRVVLDGAGLAGGGPVARRAGIGQPVAAGP